MLKKPRLLLHICCAPDAIAAVPVLAKNFAVDGFFYNPNITSDKEYAKRLTATHKVAEQHRLHLVEGAYDPQKWRKKIRGLEREKEGGKRCAECFNMRLKATAEAAKAGGYHLFATVLTNSPHKDYELINHIGRNLGNKYGILYFRSAFGKRGGFKKSVEMSQQLGLYRQNYCGCEFSVREKSGKREKIN